MASWEVGCCYLVAEYSQVGRAEFAGCAIELVGVVVRYIDCKASCVATAQLGFVFRVKLVCVCVFEWR